MWILDQKIISKVRGWINYLILISFLRVVNIFWAYFTYVSAVTHNHINKLNEYDDGHKKTILKYYSKCYRNLVEWNGRL